MLHVPRLLRPMTLILALATTAFAFGPAVPAAHAAKGKKTAAAGSRAEAKPGKAKPVTVRSIIRWHRRGDQPADIVAKARKAGWVATTKDAAYLRRAKVPADLIAELRQGQVEVAKIKAPAATRSPEPTKVAARARIDLTKPADISDIDFDKVPPPSSSPTWVKSKQSAPPPPATPPATAQKASAKRPSPALAPAAPSAPEEASAPARRKPIIAKDS